MNKFFKIKAISLMLLVLGVSCYNENETLPTNGEVQFMVSKKERSGGRVEETLTPAAVLLSITNKQNNSIIQNKKLLLYSFGSSYVSESLRLPTGDYNLTQFMVIDAHDKVIYATPVEGSELAQYVNDPLPIEFNVTKDGNTLVTPQVLVVTENDPPESFGYVSFGFEVVSGMAKVKFELYTSQDYSNENETIIFYPGAYQINSKWDSVLAPMLIKEIPDQVNKITFETWLPIQDGVAGFNYYIVGVGYSWYYDTLDFKAGMVQVISFDFK